MASWQIKNRIERELVRLGVDHAALGPADSIVVRDGGQPHAVILADDTGSLELCDVIALRLLQKLPDGAGREAVWNTLERCDMTV